VSDRILARADPLRAFAAEIFRSAGLAHEQAAITAEVLVWVPLVTTPWGEVGGLWSGASHSEPVDLYRSLP